MFIPNLILFYVDNPLISSEFYAKLFDCKPAASFPTYVAFTFPHGLTFSLWSKSAKDFVSDGSGHRCELAFMLRNGQEIRELRKKCDELGVRIDQELFTAVFGLNFVALDPDGHRIRFCLPDP